MHNETIFCPFIFCLIAHLTKKLSDKKSTSSKLISLKLDREVDPDEAASQNGVWLEG